MYRTLSGLLYKKTKQYISYGVLDLAERAFSCRLENINLQESPDDSYAFPDKSKMTKLMNILSINCNWWALRALEIPPKWRQQFVRLPPYKRFPPFTFATASQREMHEYQSNDA